MKLVTVEDSSGFRLFLTDKPRRYDAAILNIGNKISPFHVIPPDASKFTTMGYCTSECTQQTFPPEGISITHTMAHAHRSGRKINLRHIRNGVELPPIARDNSFDFNYQQFRVIQPERKVLPGDVLLTECEYETKENNLPTFGGFSPKDEMCLVYVYYYPRVKLSDCRVQPEFHSFFNAIGLHKVEGEILQTMHEPYKPWNGQQYDPVDNSYQQDNTTDGRTLNVFDLMTIVDPPSENNLTVGEHLRKLQWGENKEKIIREVEQKWLKGKHYAFCTGPSRTRIPLKEYIVSYPKFLKYRPKVQKKCKARNDGKSATRRPYPSVRNYGHMFSDDEKVSSVFTVPSA